MQNHYETNLDSNTLNLSIDFLKEIIKMDSTYPNGNEHEIAKSIHGFLDCNQFEQKIDIIDDKKCNILLKKKSKTGSKKPLVFCGHMDTVPIGNEKWLFSPLSGHQKEEKIYGRGSCDMKGGIAGMLGAIKLLETNELDFDLYFLGTSGEEIGAIGAKHFAEKNKGFDPGAMIIGEPTNLNLFVGHKGALWVSITIFGKAGHGSMPNEGINAIEKMIRFIEKVKTSPLVPREKSNELGRQTMNIGLMNGGSQINVIPDKCTIQIDFRTVDKQSHEDILDGLTKIKNDFEDIENVEIDIETLKSLSPLTNSNNKFIEQARYLQETLHPENEKEYVNYFTDGSVFTNHFNCPIIIFGPGDPKLAHQKDEYVEIDKLIKSINFYKELILNY